MVIDYQKQILKPRSQCLDEFGEITRNKGHYAFQGHSGSPILVKIDILLVVNTNLPPILHRFPDIAILDLSKAISRKRCKTGS